VSGAAKRIFIVEDQRLIAADLENTLSKLGYEIIGSAPSGEEAIRRTAESHPDLVLMDIRLRGQMDGIQAAAAIRQREDIPIVYLTAYADEETILRAKVTSPFGYVVKPLNQRELRAAIEIALYKHETDRVLAEERARRHAAEEFRLIIESVRDYAIFRLDPEGKITSWNAGAERIKGYRSEEILGRHVSIFYPPEELAAGKVESALRVAAAAGSSEDEGWRIRKDGSRFWSNVVTTALRGEQGELLGFAEVTRDLTERKREEDARRDAIRIRDEFLQVASHELKTPVTSLQLHLDTLAQALRKSGVKDDRLSARVETATRQTTRLSRLIESLLDVSRISAGRLVLKLEEFDFVEMVSDVVERFQVEATRAGCAISVDAKTAVRGRWDRLRLEQVVSNVLSNAIKYGAGKPIQLEIRDGGERVRLSVSDQGIGIDEESLERIFGRFERAVSLHHFGGLGLGLFIARQIAEAHGGSIAVRSQLGEGATFTVMLPRRPPAVEWMSATGDSDGKG
jgi:PAS domain S-box-containing protein